MRTLTLCLAALLLSASSAFAQECDRDEYAVHWFEQDMKLNASISKKRTGRRCGSATSTICAA